MLFRSEKGKELSGLTEADRSKAVVQAAELTVRNGELYCDRNAQVTWPQ